MVPSTTVSNSALSLVLHVSASSRQEPEPAGVPRIESSAAADGEGSSAQHDGGAGAGAGSGADLGQEPAAVAAGGAEGVVGESKHVKQESKLASPGDDSTPNSCGAGGSATSSVVVVSSPASRCHACRAVRGRRFADSSRTKPLSSPAGCCSL